MFIRKNCIEIRCMGGGVLACGCPILTQCLEWYREWFGTENGEVPILLHVELLSRTFALRGLTVVQRVTPIPSSSSQTIKQGDKMKGRQSGVSFTNS